MRAALFAATLFFPVALTAAEKTPAPNRAALIRWLVAHQDELRAVPFSEVVMAATGKRMIPISRKRDAAMLEKLGTALTATLTALNDPDHPIHAAGRVNEASRYIEDEIRRQVSLLPGWKCTVPQTAEGNEQRAGYPDLRIVTAKGRVIYLDPKLYEAGSRHSSLRTFYYEPRGLTGKIHDDAIHLLAGIEHSGKDASGMRLTNWELVDVSKLTVQLKAEFQSSNANIYRPEMSVGRSEK